MIANLVGLAAAAALVTPSSAHALALKGVELIGLTKISLASARFTALHARPGKVADQELEKEKGGSGLRYSFDIKSKGVTYEVGIDARTGAVLENAPEGARPD